MTRKGYYPWNAQLLSDWIRSELSAGKTPLELSNGLKVPHYTLRQWQIFASFDITLEQIQSIATYRGWNFEETIAWLGICPAHVKDLLENSKSGSKPKWQSLASANT